MDWLHEHKIDDFGNVDAGIEHIDGNGKARLIFLLEFAYEPVAIGAVVYSLDAGIDDL